MFLIKIKIKESKKFVKKLETKTTKTCKQKKKKIISIQLNSKAFAKELESIYFIFANLFINC